MTDLLHNYSYVLKNIEETCRKCGRDANEVTLVAVSKTKPEEDIIDLLKNGALHFGENKVQDLCRKMEDITSACGNIPVWHMIGTLQTNKVKYLIGSPVSLIHSVDSIHLAEAINKEAYKKQISTPVNILLEVNIGGESTKSGFNPVEVRDALHAMASLDKIKICGLMTVCPPGKEEENRQYFKAMKNLLDELSCIKLPNVDLKELSMGMSDDYRTAIEEGATIVRVGSSIFGVRDYGTPEWTPAIQDAKSSLH